MMAASCAVVVIGVSAAGRDDVARDAARGALLAKLEQQVGQFAFGQRVDQIGGGRPAAAHAHVERAIAAEREAARRIVELEGRHAEVEHHAIQGGDAVLRQQIQHVAELAMDQMQTAGKARGQTGAAGDRLGIAVDRPHRAGRGFQERRGVAAAAERAVEIHAAAARGEQADDFGQHDGNVAHCAPPAGSVKPCTRARSRASARRRSAASGSQIWKMRPRPMNTTVSDKSGIADERVGQNDTTFLVRLDRKCIRIEGGC